MEKLKNTPSLRFPNFEGNWNVGKMIDYSTFYNGKAFKQEELLDNGKYPVLRVGNLFTNNNWYFSNLELEENKYIEQNDLIYAWSATFGPRIWKGNKVIYHYHIWKVLCKTEKVNKWFFYQILDNATAKMKANSSNGFALLHITKGTIENWGINIPSLSEQTRIASFLTSVDNKLQALKQKKTLLEQYRKGVMQKIFLQEFRFKDDNGNEYPDWEEKKLGDLCNYKNGGSFENFVSNEGSYNLISLNSIDINGKLKKQHKKVTITDNSLQKGDLIMVLSDVAHGNFLGLTDIIPNDEFVLNQRMAALKPKTDFNSFYLKTFINFNQSYFKLMGQGSSQLNLSKGDVENFVVKLPILEEQTKIADFLSAIDDKIIHCQSQIEKTEVWKKGLLQQMFC